MNGIGWKIIISVIDTIACILKKLTTMLLSFQKLLSKVNKKLGFK